MKTKHYFMIAAPLALLGSIFAASAQQQDFDLPGRKAPDIPNVPVPEPGKPECVSCPDGYHCNSSKDGCEPDDPPPAPPAPEPEKKPEPEPEPDPVTIPPEGDPT